MSLREVCRCGHDIATHHEKVGSCLAARCDCSWYRDASNPDPDDVEREGMPVSEPAPSTQPYPSSWGPGAWVQSNPIVTKVRA